jgi:NADH-quinone oxidoreductase subunit G
VGAIYEYDQTAEVRAALDDKERFVAVQFSPEIKDPLAEEFGLVPETISAGKIVTALKHLGFDKVFDGGFFAAETKKQIISEIEARVKGGGKLPLIAGCTPGCNKFMKDNYPDLSDRFWNGKSPEEIFGGLVNKTFSVEAGKDPARTTAVSVSPCVAKKLEAQPCTEVRQDRGSPLLKPDGGIVLTVRELARMIRLAGIDLAALPETPFDQIQLPTTNYELPTKTSIVYGIANARIVLDSVRKGECGAVFVEILSCRRSSTEQ